MLRFAEVKQIVRLVVRFVVSIVAALLVLVVGIVAVRWVTFDTPDGSSAGRILALLVSQALRPAVLPATIVATLVCLLRLLRFSRARPAGLLTVFLLTGLSVTFGFAGVERLAGSVPQPRTPLQRRLAPGLLYRGETVDLYALRATGAVLRTVVVHEYGREPAFRVFDEAVHDPMRDQLLIGPQRMSVAMSSVENAYWRAFEPPPQLSGTFRDIAAAADRFPVAGVPFGRRFLLLAWTLALAVTSLWVVVRVSRWPLLNVLLALGIVRGYFAIFSLADRGAVREFAAVVIPQPYMSYLLPGAFAAVSLVLLLVLVLLPPFQQWKREVGRG
jgi:hypothetical protein